jgi:hypothetical protein
LSQADFGASHDFELARELDRRGSHVSVYSAWPGARLKREGLHPSKVQTYPDFPNWLYPQLPSPELAWVSRPREELCLTFVHHADGALSEQELTLRHFESFSAPKSSDSCGILVSAGDVRL